LYADDTEILNMGINSEKLKLPTSMNTRYAIQYVDEITVYLAKYLWQ